jgi:predicted AAA+ superfamily ATPase
MRAIHSPEGLANCKAIFNNQNMVRRWHTRLVRERLRAHPAVALVGPRQCGKTTLAKALPSRYFDLELEEDRVRLDVEWPTLLEAKQLVVLDEAQVWPAVFPRLRSAIDAARNRHGRFLLLGSVSPSLMRHVSESLAGRLAIIESSPFIAGELPKVPSDRLWLRGGFPDGGILGNRTFPQWQVDYLSLVTQRDLPNWGLPARPAVTKRLIAMIAAVHGQIWNASQVAASLGLTHPTVNTYLDYLEGAFLVRRLPAYRSNLKKRLVKSPKVYWRDSGLLHAVLNVHDYEDLLRRPWVGASWEGFVIEQTLDTLCALGRTFQAYYFRTSDQYEIDLVLDFGGEKWAIEVKLTSNPSAADLQRLDKTGDLVEADKRILVTRTRHGASSGSRASLPLREFLAMLR